jgi:hypothetical protein
MAVTWITPAGSLGTVTERQILEIPLAASSDLGPVSFRLIAGSLPRGLLLIDNKIKGSPVEVRKFTTSRFVVRASDANDIEDRTFSLTVDGYDDPQWITEEGFLNVGLGEAYFVLDNAEVNFQLEVEDTDITAGEILEFYLAPNGGELPPGLILSKDGIISGFTDPIFAINYDASITGAYDTGTFDTVPLDVTQISSNGFDSFFYDNQTFDYNEPSRVPRRLSRIYTFVVAVTDGINTVSRLFKIYVVTEEFLQADNNILQVDTNLFQADASADRIPIWITDSNLGRRRANNYVTIFLDVYDPPTLSGTISYLLLPINPDGSTSQLPPGMFLDQTTGEIAGRVPYQARISKTYQFTLLAVNFPLSLTTGNYNYRGSWNSATNYLINDAVLYLSQIYICIIPNRNIDPSNTNFWTGGTTSAAKTFSVEIIGEIDSAVRWISDSDLGTIKPNQPSRKFIQAESLLYGGKVTYEFVSGTLPPGLMFSPTGDITGKVRQFADSNNLGLTRFFDRDSSLIDSTLSRSFDSTFDNGSTTFDKKFNFTIKARDTANFAELDKTFSITVVADNTKTFANLFTKSFQSKSKRLEWFNFITDASIFTPADLYRYGDSNYGLQTEIKLLIFAGIESTEAVNYVQAMSRNHYRKRFLFGNLKIGKAKDPDTQETIYEVIYVEVVDDLEKNGVSITDTVELSDTIESKVLISYDAIKVDSDIPFVSDSDHQRVFPNSVRNMRNRISNVGDRDREFLPLWMRSIQDQSQYELGYTKALILCYTKPGRSGDILAKIRAANFDFKNIDFTADRYVIDIIDGEIEDKYLAFPQRGEKLP